MWPLANGWTGWKAKWPHPDMKRTCPTGPGRLLPARNTWPKNHPLNSPSTGPTLAAPHAQWSYSAFQGAAMGRSAYLRVLAAGFALAVAVAMSVQPASAQTSYCWINAATGKPVTNVVPDRSRPGSDEN